MVYGSTEVSLQHLMSGRETVEAIAAERPGGKVHDVGSHLHDMFASHQTVIGRHTLTATMEQMRWSKTEQPHDNIYAIHTLLKDHDLAISHPDYDRPVGEVYRQVAVSVIQRESYPGLFYQIGLPKSSTTINSWVPDWSQNKHALECTNMLRKHTGASSSSSPIHRFEHDYQHLIIPGVIVEHVTKRSPLSLLHGHERLHSHTKEFELNQLPLPAFQSLEEKLQDFNLAAAVWNLRTLASFLHFACFQDLEPSTTEETILFRTLYSMSWELSALDNDPDSLRILCIMIMRVAEQNTPDPDPVKNITTEETSRYLDLEKAIREDARLVKHYKSITQCAFYQTMFRTASGQIGFAPHPIRPGDNVALITGIQCPVIVRLSGGQHTIVALAYIHNYMDGQLWPDSPNKLQDFVFV